MTRAVAIIPARYESTRFPGKPLADRTGKPLIQHVYERVRQAESVGEGATPLQRELLDLVEINIGQMIALLGDFKTASGPGQDELQIEAQSVDISTTETP